MYLIDESFFIREYNIPNVQELGTSDNAGIELTLFIDERVRLFLQQALGLTEFKDLDANITSGVLDGAAPQKWKDLVNGLDYTNGGKNFSWKGLTHTDGAFKASMLVPYVYYYWHKGQVSQMTGIGDATAETKGMIRVNPSQRLVKTWNVFVELNQGAHGMIVNPFVDHTVHVSRYRGVNIFDFVGGDSESGYVDLLTYLTHNDDVYIDTNRRRYEFKNRMDL